MSRSCDCNNVKFGSRYSSDQCKVCWSYHHIQRINLAAGGNGIVHRIPLVAANGSDFKPAVVTEGPGTELKAILATVGIVGNLGCSCKAMANRMNRWGAQGCQERLPEIVTKLRINAEKLGWLEMMKARGLAFSTGLAFQIDWLDPIPSLVEEAIRRATQHPPTPSQSHTDK